MANTRKKVVNKKIHIKTSVKVLFRSEKEERKHGSKRKPDQAL